ncbi:MAG: hypothetical protein AAB512_04700 [Patescibacteria group bacterium]
MNEIKPENRERLTYEEIDKKYSGQWVVAVITTIADNVPVEGIVIAHDKEISVASEQFRLHAERLRATGKNYYFSFMVAGIGREEPPLPSD